MEPLLPGTARFILSKALEMVCHQKPERCLTIGGAPMLVCARCLGIYCGALMGILLAPIIAVRSKAILLMFAPVMIDGSINLFHTTPAGLRLVTGLVAGFAAALIVMPAFIEPLPFGRLFSDGRAT